MSSPIVFIDGDQGTTGLQIHERLRGRTDIRVVTLSAAERKNAERRAAAINDCDIAILCLPDAAARESVSMAEPGRVKVIDASTAHRTDSAWAYGLPELSPAHRDRIASARFVSVPGCYATCFALAVYPLVAHGVIAPRESLPFAERLLALFEGIAEVIAAHAPDEAAVARALDNFARDAKVLEAHLGKQPYLVGSSLTLADFSVAGPLFYAERAGLPLADYPKVREWFGRIASLPCWKETAPQIPAAAA